MKPRACSASLCVVLAMLAIAHDRGARAAGAPERVVSMNLCTDQLAMMIAEPGRLISVSYLARDPHASVMAAEAETIPINHGQAEEVFLLKPDLVLAGTYTTRTTVSLLRKLGFRVEEFAPANSLADVRANLERMGDVLGRRDAADALRADFDRRLRAISPGNGERRPTIAPYYANSYTSGRGTLVDAVISAAGLRNLGADLGLRGTAKLPLELLAMAGPDLIMLGRRRAAAPALAHEIFEHPVVRDLLASRSAAVVPDRFLVCGTPHTATAVELLFDARSRHMAERTR